MTARGVDLHLGSIGRHHDDGRDTKPLGGNGHALGMIARREGDDTLFPLFRRQLQKPVGSASKLEGAPGLETLAL